MSAAFRVIFDPPQSGVVNMARDEALLGCVGRRESPPTLRFYRWDPPTISLGYFQHYTDYAHLEPPAGDLPVVRRLTGGGAILHDCELTYSLAVPVGHCVLVGGPNRLYELAHDALIATLREDRVSAHRGGASDGSGAAKGPFFCFARRHGLDVLVGADKLAGSAQRRTAQAVLQHGSIILGQRYAQQPAAALATVLPGAQRAEVGELAGALADRLSAALAQATGVDFRPGEWQAGELALAESLGGKYLSAAWTQRM